MAVSGVVRHPDNIVLHVAGHHASDTDHLAVELNLI
jgi:hypothetical protein